MSRPHYVSDLKLCLEILAQFEIYPDLAQLEQFLAEEKHRDLLGDYAARIKTAWEDSLITAQYPLAPVLEPEPDLTTVVTVSLEKHATELPEFKHQESLTEIPPESEILKLTQQPPQKPLIRFKLPNATVGRAYQGSLEWTPDKKITLLYVSGLDELGLSYDLASNTVSGAPEQAGEHRLVISYQHDDDATQATQTAELSLVINSDPKSLWKNIPSATSVPFWKADSDYQGKAGLYNWKLAAASKRGRSHAHVGSCRDDDFALQVDNDSLWQILAVADGAGSSEFSREGAKIVAHNSVAVLTAQLQQANAALTPLIENWQLDKSLAKEMELHDALVAVFSVALRDSIETIEALAKQQQVAYRDFYSTLLIAAHKSFPNGEFIVAYWIGDGGLSLYNAGQGVELLGVSDSGEYAGQTRFLDKNALDPEDLSKRLHLSSEKSFTALLLMTDGITDPLFETDNNLRDLTYWENLWQQIQPLLNDNPELSAQQLTDWLDFWSPGNHDDRTIALIYR